VQTANRYPCEVALVKDGQEVNGKSIMGVLMLAAAKGSTVTVRTEGEQGRRVRGRPRRAVRQGFNETL